MSETKPLTANQLLAAKLFVDGDLTIAEIAAKIDVDPRTLYRWREEQDFVTEMRRISDLYEEGMVREGQAIKRNRVNALRRQIRKIEQVIEARAVTYGADDVADSVGGGTGLVVKTEKGAAGVIVTEYAADTALLRELREHQKQLAVELGQWVEKVAPTDPTGENEFGNLTDEERADRALALLDVARARRMGQADGPEEGPHVGTPSGTTDDGEPIDS